MPAQSSERLVHLFTPGQPERLARRLRIGRGSKPARRQRRRLGLCRGTLSPTRKEAAPLFRMRRLAAEHWAIQYRRAFQINRTDVSVGAMYLR